MSDFIFHAMLRSVLLLGCGAVIWPLLPVGRPVEKRRLLLIGMVLLLVVPFLPTAFGTVAATASSTEVQDARSIPLPALIWLAGSLLVAGHLALSAWKLRRIVQTAKDCGSMNLAGCALRIKESAAVESPCVTGWPQTILLVPRNFTAWEDRRWKCILWHERQHAVQHDVAALWLIRIVRALYWWNPLVHLAARQFHVESEAACDDAVLQAGNTPRDYVETLLSFTQGGFTPTLALTGTSPLRRRIERFLSHSSPPSNPWRWMVGIVSLAIVACFGAFCGLKSPHAPEAPMPTENEVNTRWSANPFPSTAEGESLPVSSEH